jgi:hypothetical protein
MTNKKCLIDNECDGSCQGYNPSVHLCSIFNVVPDVTKTATIEEEFGPSQIKAEISAETGNIANRLIALYKQDPNAYANALAMADVVIKEVIEPNLPQ